MSRIVAKSVATDNKSGVEYQMDVEWYPADDCGRTKVYIQIPDASQFDGSYLYECVVDVSNVGSEDGINNGRINKLYVRDVNTNTEVIGYDHGWYLEPHRPVDCAVLSTLLEIFDTLTK